jgi:hypothetical protein
VINRRRYEKAKEMLDLEEAAEKKKGGIGKKANPMGW